jgi:hypothetical protein
MPKIALKRVKHTVHCAHIDCSMLGVQGRDEISQYLLKKIKSVAIPMIWLKN